MTIVTTRRKDGVDVGLTANSFNSVSLEPPMILWSLAKSSTNIGVFCDAAHFAVHILSASQDELSGRFAKKTDDEPGGKFNGIQVGRGNDGIPLLLDCAAQTQDQIATTARFHDWTVTPASVDSLARKGLVATDAGKASLIRLTDEGRMAIISLIAMLKSAEADALKGWDLSEIQLMKGLLRRIGQ